MIVDAKDLLLGRMAVHVAKAALLGQEVHVVNCEVAVMSGSKQQVVNHYIHKQQRGVPAKGPFIHRKSHDIVKRAIRGMVPYRKENGKKAFARIKCYNGVPDAFAGKESEFVSFADAHVSKLPVFKYVTIGRISQVLGAKQ